MKIFDRLSVIVFLVLIIAAAAVNIGISSEDAHRQYLVDIHRIEHEISSGRDVDVSDYPSVTGIARYDGSDEFFVTEDEYVIREINGELYRIGYTDETDRTQGMRAYINISFALCAVILAAVLIFIRQKILKPFERISALPYELSKGNLTIPLREQKDRFFGKFLWGLDMLRETLEKSGERELRQARDEKTLLLSLSHDIKTPLSGIKLNSRALSKGIYTDRERQIQAAENINARADEIEKYVNEMIGRLSGSFMEFEIKDTRFYIDDVISAILLQYKDRLGDMHTALTTESHSNCLLRGDPDRLTEVLQNIMENAIKYGDGREIHISFSDEVDCRLITVRNSGCTLPESELTHIFDSFWRGSNSENWQGNGLGLFICRRLMQGMNGDIFAEISDGFMSVTAVCRKA
ncbi:MAG: HAMP domain-containing histidine kinase [Oscillospiraceae bacterium]|nr:HAMP domain-containing histidine kinase [Oscillospiraceae bacterium]